uniref:Uncharacterized protein n=1 Tax=Varanus komodoensis TaxID=61221 RepID=A0A8D2LAG6_VARKO
MGKDWERNLSGCQDPKLTCVRIPLSAQNSPLMKDLKRGQKCYFYSIMKIYDSKAPREMLHRRYAINLQCQNVLAAQRNWRAAEKSQGLEAITRRGLWAMKLHQTHTRRTPSFFQQAFHDQGRVECSPHSGMKWSKFFIPQKTPG